MGSTYTMGGTLVVTLQATSVQPLRTFNRGKPILEGDEIPAADRPGRGCS